MTCNKECENTCSHNDGCGNNFVFVVVLFILLVIILGSFIY